MATKKQAWDEMRASVLAQAAPEERIRTQIRLPPLLHEKLVEMAERNGRSFNSEMLVRLMESFK